MDRILYNQLHQNLESEHNSIRTHTLDVHAHQVALSVIERIDTIDSNVKQDVIQKIHTEIGRIEGLVISGKKKASKLIKKIDGMREIDTSPL